MLVYGKGVGNRKSRVPPTETEKRWDVTSDTTTGDGTAQIRSVLGHKGVGEWSRTKS